MSSKIYVLDGALLECNQGFTPAKLLVTQNRKVKIQGKFKATDMETQVPQTFGQCKLKPTNSGYLPCIPALQKWTKTTKKSTLGSSKKWLFEDSECMCATGGKITITDPTQINMAGSVTEEFKNIAFTIPGPMMGNDKAPKVVESYWMDEGGKEKIDTSDYGEKVTVKVKDSKGKEFKKGEKELTYSGSVKSDGTVALKLVDIDTNWNKTKNDS